MEALRVRVKDVKAAFGPGSYVAQVGKARASRWVL